MMLNEYIPHKPRLHLKKQLTPNKFRCDQLFTNTTEIHDPRLFSPSLNERQSKVFMCCSVFKRISHVFKQYRTGVQLEEQ